ncbi:MAG: substrate-binding domain-containing protein, partial [Actinomycetota bacterium]
MDDALTVVVLSPMAGGYYYGAVLAGITREVAAAGGHVVLVQTMEAGLSNEEFPAVPDFDASTGWDRASGFISLAASASASYLARVGELGKPMVLAGNLVEGVEAPAVMPDNVGGVRASVEHLIEHGHTRIGFAGNYEQFDMIERHSAYVDTLALHGLDRCPNFEFVPSDNTEIGGRQIAEAVAALRGHMTAIILATDRNALGLMEALPRLGVQPGQDLAVIGFDDIELARHSTPTLSTVGQSIYRMGEVAGRLILAQIRGETVAPERYTTASTLVIRESCGCQGVSASEILLGDEQRPSGLRDALIRRVSGIVDSGRDVGSSGGATVSAVVDEVLEILQDTANGRWSTDLCAFERVAVRLFAGKHESDRAAAVVTLLVEYGRSFLDAIPDDDENRRAVQDAVIAMALAFLVAQGGNHALRSMVSETTVRAQYEIGVHLLRHDSGDPRNLAWLSSSAVSVACLALWDSSSGADGDLRIVGVYDPTNRMLSWDQQRAIP